MKKLLLMILVALCVPLPASAATTLPVQLLNPTGSTAGQAVVSTGASSAPAWGNVAVGGLASVAANTMLGNATGGTATPTAVPMPSCSTTASALQWLAGSGFACNTALVAANVSGVVAVSNGGTASSSASGTALDNITGFAGTGWMNRTGAGTYTFTPIIPVAGGGTNASTASGTSLDNITGFAGTGFLTRTGAGAYAFQSTTNGITFGNLSQLAANSVLGNPTGSTANLSAAAVPSCSTSASALQWTSGTGFGCNTAVNAATLGGATFAAPGPIGSTTPSTGAFTTLSTSGLATLASVSTASATITGGTVNGTAIGGTTPAAGTFTTLSAGGNDALQYANSSGQSIPNNAFTTVTTWTQRFDRLGTNFNATTGVFTAPATGYYQVDCQLVYASAVGVVAAEYSAGVLANGTLVLVGSFYQEATSTDPVSVQVSGLVNLTAGQTLAIQAFQNTGSARLLQTSRIFLSISRIP